MDKFSFEYIHLYETKGSSFLRAVMLAIACGICFWAVTPTTPVEIRLSAGNYFVYAMPLCFDFYNRTSTQPSRYGINKGILTFLTVATSVSAVAALVVSFSPNQYGWFFLLYRIGATVLAIVSAVDAVTFIFLDDTDAIELENPSEYDKLRQEKFKEKGSIPTDRKGDNNER